jgi:gluconokinase
MKYWIGVDIGTTSTKAVLFTADGSVVTSHHVAYELYRDPTGMAEEAPDAIFEAVLITIRALSEKLTADDTLCAIGFCAQQHSLIALSHDFKPMTRVITWADTRAKQYATALRNSEKGHAIFMKTGTPIQPMSPLSKLLWLKNEQPDIFKQARYFVDIKTYVFNRLFGVTKIDMSLASTTGFFNLSQGQWDQKILDLVGISKDNLPEIVEPYEIERGLLSPYAEKMGIPQDTPFVWGAADGPMSNLGVNAIQPGVAALTIGTSGAMRVITDRPLVDEKARTFTYALDASHWVVGGATNSGAAVLAWLQQQVFDDQMTMQEITALAEQTTAGSKGLIFHPYLGGERAPIWNADASASFFGLGYEHGRAELSRAVLEGITYNMHAVATALQEVVGEISTVQATGGFTNSELWLQISADIFDMPINIPNSKEAGCLAAVILAQKALGVIDDIARVQENFSIEKVYQPNPENTTTYRELETIYSSLLATYQNNYSKLADFKSG